VFSQLINQIFIWNHKRLENNLANTEKQQSLLLEKIVNSNKCQNYLKQLGINTSESFLSNCPLIEYDDLEFQILKIRDKEINELCSEEIVAFSKSSGTTSRSKYLPMTKASIQANFTAGKTMLSHFIVSNPNSKIFEGKNFSLTGSYSKIGKFVVGDVSSLFTYFLSPWYKPFRTPNLQIATIEDWNEKLEKLVPILAKSDIRWIAGVPSWMRVVMEKVEDYTKTNINIVWPNLEVYFYGGVNIKPFESYFFQKFDGRLKLWQTYNASEGFFGLQMEKGSESMGLLFNTENYYEFIPYCDIHIKNPRILCLTNLEVDKKYELVITNNSGLYRYRLGDIIKVNQLNPLRFELVGRTKNSINIFGEELMVTNTEQAIAELHKEFEFSIKDYTVAPVINEMSGHHHWQIEFISRPQDMEKFKLRLDEIIRKLNSDYDAKRYNDLVLKPLTIEVLKNNSIEKWLEYHNRKTVQAKVPKLWKDNSIQKQLAAILNP
jgi:hypothetical protein